MEAFLSGGPIEETVAAETVATNNNAGWCPVCKCFISQKRAHTSAECDANIAKRKNRSRSSKRRIRLTPKRVKRLNDLINKAVWCEQVQAKLLHILKGTKNKIGVKRLKKLLNTSAKSESRKIKSYYRSFGL